MRRLVRRVGRGTLLAAALSAGLLAGGGAAWAYWSVTTGHASAPAVRSGTFDMVVAGASGTLAGTGGSVTIPLTVANAVPGTAVSSTVTVGNDGDAAFTVTASAATTGTLGSTVVTVLSFGGTGAACTGGTGATSPAIPPGPGLTLCVAVTVPAGTPSSSQGRSGTVVITLNAAQAP